MDLVPTSWDMCCLGARANLPQIWMLSRTKEHPKEQMALGKAFELKQAEELDSELGK